MKVVPAPKLRGRDGDLPVPKNNYNRPPPNVEAERYQNRQPIESHERFPERHNERFPGRQNERFPERQNERYPERQNERFPERQNEEYPERQNERLPERLIERLPERLPEKEQESEYDREPERPQLAEQVDYDERPESLPALKPVIRTPTIIRHVYGGNTHSSSGSPTIPSRYLKDMPIIKSSEKKYKNPLQSLPPISEILPPIKDQSDNYKTEPIVNHKYVNLGDVYRKATSEEEIPQDEASGSNSDESLDGYAKDPYDKQLVNTLKNLMASSKERHPLNIGGLSETDSNTEDTYKTNAKPLKTSESYFSSIDSFSRQPQTYETVQTTSQQNHQLIPQSLLQYSSQSQTSSQSRIPESFLTPVTTYGNSKAFSSISTQSLTDKYLSPASEAGVTHMVQLLPGQVPVLPDLSTNRKPVAIDFDYNTAARPLSPSSFFDEQAEQKSVVYEQKPVSYGQSQILSVNTERVIPKQAITSYQTQQPQKTYVVSGLYRKQYSQDQDKDVEQLDQYDDKVRKMTDFSNSYMPF